MHIKFSLRPISIINDESFALHSRLHSELFFIAGRAYFHSFILSVPHGWSGDQCRFRQAELEVPRRADIVITDRTGPGYVEHHTWRDWDTRGNGLVMPMSVVNNRNLTRMMDLWTEYR